MYRLVAAILTHDCCESYLIVKSAISGKSDLINVVDSNAPRPFYISTFVGLALTNCWKWILLLNVCQMKYKFLCNFYNDFIEGALKKVTNCNIRACKPLKMWCLQFSCCNKGLSLFVDS